MSGRYIYNIECLKRKIGCATYEDLKAYGYDVDGYFERHRQNDVVQANDDEDRNFVSRRPRYRSYRSYYGGGLSGLSVSDSAYGRSCYIGT